MKEVWKPVVGHEDRYEVSNRGQVRSKDYVVTRKFSSKVPSTTTSALYRGRILKRMLMKSRTGRRTGLTVGLYFRDPETDKCTRVRKSVGQLVAQAFYPGYSGQVKYINDDPADCRLVNIQPPKGQEPYEVFKVISEYPEYSVSNRGRVKSNKDYRNKCLHPVTGDDGYIYVRLRAQDGKTRKLSVHRLVAIAFLPNPDNKPTVDHIDGCKHNNDVDNLRWATHSEQQHYLNASGKKAVQSVQVRCLENGVIYPSKRKAEQVLGLTKNSVGRAIQNGRPVRGYTFEEVRRIEKKIQRKLFEVGDNNVS